ncbi:MAG: NPCBM/NEW2 domain-containing protein [uncultured Clostridium sp.]
MYKKKIAAVTMAIIISNFSATTLSVLADEISTNTLTLENTNNKKQIRKAAISKFDLYNNDKLDAYNEVFKMDNLNILSIANNGGKYGSSTIDKAIDGNLSTHWETGRPNSSEFTNEVVFTLNEITNLNRIVYAARQDGARGKGFAQEVEIYTSLTDDEDDFKLVTTGEYTGPTSDIVEIKFDSTEFKRIKFIFKQANQNWASASEFMFYKEDNLGDKVNRLFTDESMNQLSEEFNSLDKINALEEVVKNHPLYEDYKQIIEDARQILNGGEVNYTDAKVSIFNINGETLENYDNIYKLPIDEIKSITNNGGHYSDLTIDKAIDGDINTKWHSGKQNTSNFTNEVVIELKELTTLNRLVYTVPRGSNRGFAQAFDIYASKTSKGDTFKLVTSGTSDVTQDSIEIKFNPTEFKRLKFVFKKGYENWACAAEFALYKEDKVRNKIDSLFTNGLMNELSENFKTMNELSVLESEVQSHPLKELFMEDIELAKDIINNGANLNNPIELERRGNSIQEANKRKVWGFKDWQVTGLTARPGDVLEVYVDVKDGEPTPKLEYKQSINRHGTSTTFNLVKGKNKIVIPEYDNERDDVEPGTIFGGALYLTNYESDQQSVSPRVRIEGAKQYPVYVDGKSNDEQLIKELEEYVNKVHSDPSNTVDVFDVSTNQTLVTVKATYALEWYRENNKMPSFTANRMEKIMNDVYEFWGFDNSTELNSRFNSRMIFMTKNITGGTFMNAGGGVVGVRPSSQSAILNADRGWGLMHEIGHNMDTAGRTMVELTNNIVPIYMPTIEGNVSRITTDNVWERKIYPKVSKEYYEDNLWEEESGEDSLAQLSPLWQLHLYDNTFYPKFEQTYRANNFNLNGKQQITESWVKVSSDILGLDLYEFFERHGIHASEEIKAEVSKYSKPDKKLWYLNDNKINYKGNGFTKDINLDVSLSRLESGIKLTFNIDNDAKSDLLGYEILKDGKVIGFTSTNTFIDNNADKSKSSEYKVIPYDINLGTGNYFEINSFAPSISIQQNKLTLELKEEFEPMEYIKVLNREGNDITSEVKVEHNVDTNNEGVYQVKYIANDDGVVAEKYLKVEVVSEVDYLSDEEWEAVETQYGEPRRNSDINGRVNGDIKRFEKGFGIHANGKITYDLSNKNYDRFEALLGVDMLIEEQDYSSITFKIIGDGKTLATTKVLKHADNMEYVNVDVRGVNKLVIEIHNGGNGNTCDHGIIANPKLTIANSKPVTNSLVARLDKSKGGMMLSTSGLGLRFFTSIENVDPKEAATYYITTASNSKETPKFEIKSTIVNKDYSQIKTSIEFSELSKLEDDVNTKLYLKRVKKGQEPTYTELTVGDVDFTNAFNISDSKISISITGDNNIVNLNKSTLSDNLFKQGLSNISWNSTGMVIEGTPTLNGNSNEFENSKVSVLFKDSSGNYIQQAGKNIEIRGVYKNDKYEVTIPYNLLNNVKTFELRLIGLNVQNNNILTKGDLTEFKSTIHNKKEYILSEDSNGVINLTISEVDQLSNELTSVRVTTDPSTGIQQFSLRGSLVGDDVDNIKSSIRYTLIAKKDNDIIFEQLITRVKDSKGSYNGFKANIALKTLLDANLNQNDEVVFTLRVDYLGNVTELNLNSVQELVSITDLSSNERFEMISKDGKAVLVKK